MLEDSLAAPFHPGAVFDAAAALPAPSYAAMTANAGTFAAAFLAINFAHAWLAFPALPRYGPFWLAFGALWLFIAAVLSSYAAAGVLHIVSRLLGASADFKRTYQIVSVASSLAAYQAILNWFPALWPIPLMSGAVIAAVGLQRLHSTPRRPTWAAAAVLCLLAASLVEVALRALRNPLVWEAQEAALAAQQLQQAAATTQQLQQAVPAPQAGPPGAQTTPLPAMPTIPVGDLSVPQTGPEEEPRFAAPRQAEPGSAPLDHSAPQTPQQLQGMLAGPLAMVDSMLNNPAMMKGMPPEKAKQMRELGGILKDLQSSMKTGRPLTAEQEARMRQVFMQVNAEMMKSAAQAAPAPRKRDAR